MVAREVEEGRVYTGKVVKVEDFGCFVELWPGCEGLCHVSQLAWERVDKASDMFKVGDEIIVRAEGYDNRNRLNLSRKSALPKPVKKEEKADNGVYLCAASKEQAERAVALIGDNCQLIETEDSNHDIHGAHTQVYLDAINSFLKEYKE